MESKALVKSMKATKCSRFCSDISHECVVNISSIHGVKPFCVVYINKSSGLQVYMGLYNVY